MSDVELPAAEVPADSPLGRLRAQHMRLRDEASNPHVHVPRTTDPEIWVSYRPVEPDAITAAIEKRQKQAKHSKKAKTETVLNANADVLVEHCEGIYWLDADGKEHSLDPDDDDWPRFDQRLARLLGVETDSAIETCKALFSTHADLVAHAGNLARQSGLSDEDLQERIQGE